MKKITLMFIALFMATFCFSQKVVIVGMNHLPTDGFTFVATEDIPFGEIIYFTDNEYDAASNAFTFNGYPTGEAVIKYQVDTNGLSKGAVVYVYENEFVINALVTSCMSGNCGSAALINGSFALSTNGEGLYAYSDDDDDNATNGISDIYSVLYSGSGALPVQNGGTIPSNENPLSDFPNAIVIDVFPADTDGYVGLNRVEYMFDPANLRENVTSSKFQDIANWLHTQLNTALSTVAFTNVLPIECPEAPTVTTPVEYCVGDTATALAATATGTLTWYDSDGTTVLPEAPTPSTANAGDTIYYVTQTENNCESPQASITVTIYALPIAPTVTTPVEYCVGDTATALTATAAGTLIWYDSDGTTVLPEAPIPSTATAGDTIYYVTQTENNCESPQASITVTVYTLPTITLATAAVCSTDLATYSISVNINSNLPTVTSSAGGTIGAPDAGQWAISGIPAGFNTTLTVTDVNGNGCVQTFEITAPDCICPEVAAPTGEASQIACDDGSGVIADYDFTYGANELWSGSYASYPDSNPGLIYFTLELFTDFSEQLGSAFGDGEYCSQVHSDYSTNVFGKAYLPDGQSVTLTNDSATNVFINYFDPTSGLFVCYSDGTIDITLLPGESVTLLRTGTTVAPVGTTATAMATPAAGASLVWYDAATEGNQVTPEQVGVGSSMFWAASVDDVTGCESADRFKVTVTINAAPTYFVDNDGDGFGTTPEDICSATVPTGYATVDGDCDDLDDTVYPDAPELCDGKDNNCNDLVDDGISFTTYYTDSDSDTYGDANDIGESLCADPNDGRVTNNTDCNDGDPTIYPGANGVENDCDPSTFDITCNEPIIVNTDPGTCYAHVSLDEPTVSGNTDAAGNALSFDGSNDYVEINPLMLGTSDFTIEFWVNAASLNTYPILFAQDKAGQYAPNFRLEVNTVNNTLTFFMGDGANNVVVGTTSSLIVGMWTHIAIVRSGNNYTTFMDGQIEGSSSTPGSINQSTNAFPFRIGARTNLSTTIHNPFNGTFDKFRIWNTVRTQAEIQVNLNNELSTETGLVVSYNLNEGVANGNNSGVTTAPDSSGNGNDGTLNNFALAGATSNWVGGIVPTSNITLSNNAPYLYGLGDTTVTWTATDDAGNTATCEQIVTVSLGEHIWTGAIDSDWTNSANWQDGLVPGLEVYSNITIPTGTPNYPVLTLGQNLTVWECSTLTVEDGASLTINPNVVLTNYGTVNNNIGGTITFKSDATGSAYIGASYSQDIFKKNVNNKSSVVEVNEPASFNGDITIERYIPAKRAFRLLSSPVTTSTFIKNNWQQGTHITGSTSGANGFDETVTGNPSMFTFDNLNQAWSNIPNTDATNLINGTPYQLMVRGDTNTDLTNNNATPSPTTLVAIGTLDAENTAPEPLVLSAAEGSFSFIGNPFQAPVNMSLVLNSNIYDKNGMNANSTNVNPNFYWVWDPNMGIRGAFVAVPLMYNFASPGESLANQYLQAGQACWVETISTNIPEPLSKNNANQAPLNASVTFTQFSKNTGVPETAVFKTTAKKVSTGQMRLTLFESSALAANESAADGVLVIFDDTGNNAVDAFDAVKFTNLDETFATSNNGTLLAIESRATPVNSDEIPLSITTYRDSNYTIVAEGTEMQGDLPQLYDAYTNVYTDIPQNGTVNYVYSVNANIPASIAADRFTVVFASQTLSVSNLDIEHLKMYPNPSSTGQFYLNIPNNMDDLEVTIYNTLGAKLFYKTGFTAGQRVSIKTNFTRNHGLYLVNLTSKGITTTKKLIIN